MRPYSKDPQWSQNVGLLYVCVFNLCLFDAYKPTQLNYSEIMMILILQKDSGGFRHVPHVRPNKAPTKRSPHKRSGNFFAT